MIQIAKYAQTYRQFSLVILALLAPFYALGDSPVAHFGSAQTVVARASSECFGVAVDSSGNVYIADTFNNRVLKETFTSGGYTESVIAIGLNKPYGVAVDNAGNVFVADTYNNQIVKESLTSGSYSPSVVVSVKNPWNVAVDKSGNLYVAGGNGTAMGLPPFVYKETPSGSTYQQSLVADASSGLSIPMEVTVDSSGNLFVTDSGTESVYKFSPSGSTYTKSTIASGFQFPTGVTVDGNGIVYVADAYQNQILAETPSSNGTYTQSVFPTSLLNFPYELAAGRNGEIFVANPQNFDALKVSTASPDLGAVSVGAQSGPVSLNFVFDSASTINHPAVFTQAVADFDFVDDGQGSCTTNGTSLTYQAGQTCSVEVLFHPYVSGVSSGAAVLTDPLGDQIAVAYIRGTGLAPQVAFSPAPQSLVPSYGTVGPSRVAVDGAQDVFSIHGNDIVEDKSSFISTLFSNLNEPTSIAVDAAGNLYITLVGSRTLIRETPYSGGYYQSLTATGFSLPMGVTVDNQGNIYVADLGLFEVLKIAPAASGFAVSSVGTGLRYPSSVAVDGNGVVYIGNSTNQVTVETPSANGYTQSVLTFSGATINNVAADMRGYFYTVDTSGAKVTRWSMASGTLVGTNVGTNIQNPYDVSIDRNGNAFITNVYGGFSQITEVGSALPPVIQFANTPIGSTSTDSPQSLTLLNVGNEPLTFPIPSSGENPSISDGFSLNDNAPGACPQIGSGFSSPGMLAAGSSCSFSFSFAPTVVGIDQSVVGLLDNSLNAPAPNYKQQGFFLIGQGLPLAPIITSPAQGSMLPGSSVTFGWNTVPGVSFYSLWIGTQGVGSRDLFNSGNINTQSATVSNLPVGGQTIYVRLFSWMNGGWQTRDCTFKAFGTLAPATIISPSPGSTLVGSAATFNWTSGTGVSFYSLWVGTQGVGSRDVYNSGNTSALSVNVPNLPTNARPVYVRLFSWIGNAWQTHDYTYTASGQPVPAAITSPAPGSTLVSTVGDATFTWNAGTGVSFYSIWVGSQGVGSRDLYNSGNTPDLAASVSKLPTDGRTIYVRLFSWINNAWQTRDYTFVAVLVPAPAEITSPIAASTLPGSTATFTWSPGAGVSFYSIWVGTQGAGSRDLYNSGNTTVKSVTLSNLPTDGRGVYVSLFSWINGAWQTRNYWYYSYKP